MMDAQIDKGERIDLPKETVININKMVNMPGSVYNGHKQEKYNVVLRGYVARNKDYSLYLFLADKDSKTFRRRVFHGYNDEKTGYWDANGASSMKLDPELFPDVQWEDSYPTEVQIRIM